MSSLGNQIPWTGDNVQGHSWSNGRIDLTEGLGAYNHVFKRVALGSRIVDVGGGAYDTHSAYVARKYLIDCSVYDPYKRDAQHNLKIIENSKTRPFDGAISFSVLNVISNDKARRDHVKLCQTMLKTGGKAIFKVWPGDKTENGEKSTSGYQSNRDIGTYLDEIRNVFGLKNVRFDSDNKIIIGINPIVAYPSGTLAT
jgi:hypothetical protein